MTPAAFDAWLKSQTKATTSPTRPASGAGRLQRTTACGSCHTLKAAGATGRSAPTSISCRSTRSRRASRSRTSSSESIVDPNAYVAAGLPEERHAAVREPAEGPARRARPVSGPVEQEGVSDARDRDDRRPRTSTRRAPPPHGRPGGYLLGPGWIRAAWMTRALLRRSASASSSCFRWWGGWHPLCDWQPIVLVSLLVAAPLGFLAGHRRVRLLGRATRSARRRGPRTTRATARTRWKRLLPRQHRPQGDRRPVPRHDDRLLRHRRPARDARARRARAAGDAVRRPRRPSTASSRCTRR